MTSEKHREEMDRLASALVDDLLDTPDEELIGELAPGEAEAILVEGRGILEGAKRKAGKAALTKARQEVNREASARRHYRPGFDPATARRRLTSIVANSSSESRVTLAARGGKGIPDEDLDGLIEDARDLGFEIDNEPEKKA